ncbi:TPA: hypothetical protein WIC14_001870 [Neisseria meningitidis]
MIFLSLELQSDERYCKSGRELGQTRKRCGGLEKDGHLRIMAAIPIRTTTMNASQKPWLSIIALAIGAFIVD